MQDSVSMIYLQSRTVVSDRSSQGKWRREADHESIGGESGVQIFRSEVRVANSVLRANDHRDVYNNNRGCFAISFFGLKM